MPLDKDHNYREVPIIVDGHELIIGGFGNAAGAFKELHTEKGIGAVINLSDEKDDDNTNEFVAAGMDVRYYTQGSKVEVTDWWEIPFRDAERIKPSVYDNVYESVRSAQKAGLKIAIHCGSGDGRTGTALSALKLRELLEKAYVSNPAIIEMEHAKSIRLHVLILMKIEIKTLILQLHL